MSHTPQLCSSGLFRNEKSANSFNSTNLIGKDRLGIQYLTMASSAAEEFARYQPAYIKKEEEPISDTEKSISCVLWGVFNATEYGSLHKKPCNKYLP